MRAAPYPSARLQQNTNDLDGVVAQQSNGSPRLVLSSNEIMADAMATLPKITAAQGSKLNRGQWKQTSRKLDVDLFELVPEGTGDASDDPQIVHAMLAKTEIHCHLNEVLNVLVNSNPDDYHASLPALYGDRLRHTDTPFHQHRRLPTATNPKGSEGVVSVQLTTIKPSLLPSISRQHKSQQTLAFGCCTQKSPTDDRAVHIMKTLPKRAHEQLVLSTDSTALRRQLDHIAVGFDIQSTHGSYGARSHTTHIVTYAYASGVSPTAFFNSSDSKQKIVLSKREMAAQRKSVMNPEARGVVAVLAKSLRNMETVIRRRRFGFSAYDNTASHTNDHTDDHISPSASTPTPAPRNCQVCVKPFSLFRRDRFCQLCGHTVCGECSRMYDVEPRPGHVRQNRICVHCVARVDACVFDDEDLLAALGPVVVDVDESVWDEDYPLLRESNRSSERSVSSTIDSLDEISGHLYSQNPHVRSHALRRLQSLVQTSAGNRPLSSTTSQDHQAIEAVDVHVRDSLRAVKPAFPIATECPVYDRVHDYAYEFPSTDPHSSTVPPLAPQQPTEKEATRLRRIGQTGVLAPTYDREALNVLARVAATRLQCPMGWVSVVGEHDLHVVGAYQYPTGAMVVPRDQVFCTHGVYAEMPFVLTNTQRDLRFAHLPAVTDLNFQFYAGFPIRADDGGVVATLCTGDYKPHNNITTKEYATMETLADLAAKLLGVKNSGISSIEQ